MMISTRTAALALLLTSASLASAHAQAVVYANPPGPAYRFDPGPPPYPPQVPWSYVFDWGHAASPAFQSYAPGFVSGPATGAPPTGNYYATPCYLERQEIWDGARWSMRRVRICR